MEENVNFYNPPISGETVIKFNYYIFSNNRIHLEGYQSIKNSPTMNIMNIKFPINISKITNITFLRYDMDGNTSRVKDWSLSALYNNSLHIKLEFDATDTWNGFLFTVDGYI